MGKLRGGVKGLSRRQEAMPELGILRCDNNNNFTVGPWLTHVGAPTRRTRGEVELIESTSLYE